ncbi:MAG: hypothetical protein H7Z40_04710 [Phycisphaerae bacterium]|nr:hypothetical protein [Gemmatimonadaceae bacterium]
MRKAATSLLIAVLSSPVLAQDTSQVVVPRDEIEAAITRAKGKAETVELRPSRINVSGTGFSVQVEGPANRIESFARQQLKKYLPVTIDTIPQNLLKSALTIVATPLSQVTSSGPKGEIVTSPATHAVLAVIVDGAERILQPISIETFDVEVRGIADNHAPARMYKSKGIRASFAYPPIPAAAFKIRVVTEGREYEYEVDSRKRALLRE